MQGCRASPWNDTTNGTSFAYISVHDNLQYANKIDKSRAFVNFPFGAPYVAAAPYGLFFALCRSRSIRAFGFGYCPEGNTPLRLRYCPVGNTRSFCEGETFMSHLLSRRWGMKNPTQVEKR